MKAQLILVISERMGSNRKKGRHENKLIRMGEKARENLGLAGEKTVEVWPDSGPGDRISRSKELEIFQAYKDDIKKLRESNMPEEDFNRVGFVTARTFEYVCRDHRRKKSDNIWLADTVEDTVVGGDPEFLLMNNEGLVKYASTIRGLGHEDDLGSDGPLAEVRPEPAISVDDFVNNIRSILRDHPNRDLIEQYEWQAICFHRGPSVDDPLTRDWSVGGHIHLGSPMKLQSKVEENYAGYDEVSIYRRAVFSCLNKALDEYVAIPTLKLESKEKAAQRRTHYGFFGEYRVQHNRLEYRTLSCEWMSHPDIALAVTGSVKAVAHAFMRILDESDYAKSLVVPVSSEYTDNFYSPNFDQWKNIEIMQMLNAVRSTNEMKAILNRAEMTFDKSYFNKLKRMFRALSTYAEYSEYVDKFLEIVKLPAKVLLERDRELKHTWIGNAKLIN
jgi:hypothetical protein